MSTEAKQPLHLKAHNLGPVIKLDALLSRYAQNIIYARNGTGKSFLSRALRYLDMQKQGQDISDAAASLVSEEAEKGLGGFALTQGQGVNLGSLELNKGENQVNANSFDRIFHVFSDEFIQNELRMRQFNPNGTIDGEIQLDHDIGEIKEVEKKLKENNLEITKKRSEFAKLLNDKKQKELREKAFINRSLRDFIAVDNETFFGLLVRPERSERSLEAIVKELAVLRALPDEPACPKSLDAFSLPDARLEEINGLLKEITSPSTVSEDIKQHILKKDDFLKKGTEILEHEKDDNCPFCQQSIAHEPTKGIIESYLAYFADAEANHKTALRNAWKDVNGFKEALRIYSARYNEEVLRFEELRKFLPSQKDVQLPEIAHEIEKLLAEFENYLSVIADKGRALESVVEIPKDGIEAQLTILDKKISSLNKAFADLTLATQRSGRERKQLQRDACAAFRQEFAHEYWDAIKGIQEQEEAQKKLKEELEAIIKVQPSASVKDRVAKTFELLIRNFFGEKYSFDRQSFVLKREDKEMVRCVSKTLSDGEKTAIAFCYFIASIHKKVTSLSDYPRLFLVFDDPIASMSYDYVFTIAQTLKYLKISASGDISINPGDVAQSWKPDLLIFTHSSYFYNICNTNGVVKKDAGFALEKRNGAHQLLKQERYIAPFEQHLKEVFEVHQGREPDHSTGNAIRCVLEAIGRFCHPDKCDKVTDFMKYLADNMDLQIKSVLIHNLSHGTYYDETPTPEELREACVDTIKVVHRYAGGQLELIKRGAGQDAAA